MSYRNSSSDFGFAGSEVGGLERFNSAGRRRRQDVESVRVGVDVDFMEGVCLRERDG